MLLQAALLPSAASCSAELLLPALDQPLSPPPVEHDFEYPETRLYTRHHGNTTGAVTTTLGLTTATATTMTATTTTDTTMETSTAGSTDISTSTTAVVPVPPHRVPATACNVMVSTVLLQQQSEPVTVSRTTTWRRAKEE